MANVCGNQHYKDKLARLIFCQTQPKWLQILRRQCCLSLYVQWFFWDMKIEILNILFNVKQYLSALLLLTGDVTIVKFIRACLSLQLTFGIQLFCPILATYHSNIGPTSGLFSALDFDMLEMDLWPILTTYHTHKSVRFSQVKWRKLQVIPCLSKRSFCLLPIRGCWGKMWTSKGKLLVIQASPRKSSFTQYGMVWYDMVWDGHPSFT